MAIRRGTPNYHLLSKHVLEISDRWKSPELLAEQPNGRLLAIATVFAICFGPDSAEAIARDLMMELDEFDAGDLDNPESKPGPAEREVFLTELLRKEFSGDFV